MGSDNTFHVSLQNGHDSDAVICSSSQIISVGKLNQESGKVISRSKSYQFIPQTTTYLQVVLSAAGSPVIQQIPVDEALLLLNQTTRQIHQISRVLLDCNVSKSAPIPTLLQEPIAITTVGKPEIKNRAQFNVLFDFDNAGIKSKHSAVLRGMTNFIQAYPQIAVTLEGHTDNKGPESYHLKLSESRVNMVKNILVDKYGVDAMRLSTVGYGETMPVDSNNTEKGRQNNRRVVAIVSQRNN
ncbi:outer membrane protein OprF, OmpA/OmpF family [Psychrobacter arcticus 273-4]|uniref:Outer membrane protein OprF, OmpA/OmpF family n=1 Tax=Psychrobacter arcticus (strain DSM 17307 / VKM B-2377 / 273-4) TaxID=259536 RepID=Q4FRA8_PSYA2|nr:OmpA family protein [Psychrobacter arcticus]AAZ19450.1 outer membrane protein OprF, OmpA/OmpF family [Psychrobacter arcticus 273-4]